MDIYNCTIVDSEGFTIVDFQHKSESLNKAEQFELLVLEAVRNRDGEPRFLFTAPDDSE